MSEKKCTPSTSVPESDQLATRRSPGGRPGTISSGERLCRPVPASYAPKERRKHAIALRPNGIPFAVLLERLKPEHDEWRVQSQRKRNNQATAVLKAQVA